MTRFPHDHETCPNCLNPEARETKGMVCQSCGHDYASEDTSSVPHPGASLGVTLAEAADAADAAGRVIRQAGMSMATAKREAGPDPFPCAIRGNLMSRLLPHDRCPACGHDLDEHYLDFGCLKRGDR